MKTRQIGIIAISALFGTIFSTTALSQSEAESEAYQSIKEPLSPGSGITFNTENLSPTPGAQSDAIAQAHNNVQEETDRMTSIPNAEGLDELSAEGHSESAANAIENQ